MRFICAQNFIDQCTELHIKPNNTALPAHAIVLPSDQTDGAWSKLVHQDSEWKRGSAQQEGADGKTQIQHLFLVHTAEPLFNLIAGGQVAQRHNHGLVLCDGYKRGTFGLFGHRWEPD